MKKPVILLIIILSAITGVFLGSRFIRPEKASNSVEILNPESKSPTPAPTPSPIAADPVTFAVPKLGINAAVESVGLDSQNKMDIPKQPQNVAWYNLGSKPGEFGNAVIAGHFDTASGTPAVFYKIGSLKAGDKVTVTDEKNKTYTYSVTRVVAYKFDEVPLQEIFGEAQGTYLNLITCEGSFNSTTKNYSHRTVVYTELVQ